MFSRPVTTQQLKKIIMHSLTILTLREGEKLVKGKKLSTQHVFRPVDLSVLSKMYQQTKSTHCYARFNIKLNLFKCK